MKNIGNCLCCCCSLRTGGFVIAGFKLFSYTLTLFSIVIAKAATSYLESIKNENPNPKGGKNYSGKYVPSNEDVEMFIKGVSSISMGFTIKAVIMMMLTIIFIIGLVKYKARCILPYVVGLAVEIVAYHIILYNNRFVLEVLLKVLNGEKYEKSSLYWAIFDPFSMILNFYILTVVYIIWYRLRISSKK